MAPGQRARSFEKGSWGRGAGSQIRTKWWIAGYLPTPQVREAPAAGINLTDSRVCFVAFADFNSVNTLTVAKFMLQMVDNRLATFFFF